MIYDSSGASTAFEGVVGTNCEVPKCHNTHYGLRILKMKTRNDQFFLNFCANKCKTNWCNILTRLAVHVIQHLHIPRTQPLPLAHQCAILLGIVLWQHCRSGRVQRAREGTVMHNGVVGIGNTVTE